MGGYSESLTAKQRQVLVFIGQNILHRGYVPTVREMCEGLSLSSPATVQNHVRALKTKGYLTGQDGMARTLSLTTHGLAVLREELGDEVDVPNGRNDGESFAGRSFGMRMGGLGKRTDGVEPFDDSRSLGEIVSLPLVGRVAAGTPILAEENVEETLVLPASLVSGGSFMLRVHGDSMVNVGIFDGDLLIVQQKNTAEDHDIVVAMIDGEATVKTFYRERDRIRLQPENDTMAPIYSHEVDIVGKVVGLLRTKL